MVESTVISRGVLLAASTGLLWGTVRTYRGQKDPVGESFSVVLGLLGATALCLSLTAGTGSLNKLIWLFTNLSIPIALLAFSCSYYGIALFTDRVRTVAVITPAVLGLVGGVYLILGTPEKTPGDAAPVEALSTLPGAVTDLAGTFDAIGTYYSAGLVIVAVGVIGLNVLRYDHLDTRLAALIAFIAAWPWLGNALVPELGALYGDSVTLGVLAGGYATSTVIAGLVLGPLGLLSSSPAAGNVGPERVLDSIDDAVLIIDNDGRLIRLNAVACETFGNDPSDVIGQQLADCIGVPPELLADARSVDESIELETVDGVRQFAVTGSRVVDGRGFDRGTTFVLRDVTRRQTREQRLEVLNRVLRHNLRNNATAIIGRAELISDGHNPESSAEEIIETTEDLVGIAESARTVETMMSSVDAEEQTAIAAIVERAVTTVEAEYPEVDITTAVPADAVATINAQTLETAVEQLVENAAEHNDATEPIVVVSVDESDGETVTIAVADNGPGIPEHERAVIDSGEEDQLQHGSGLGLWAVYWGVTQMGGSLSISERNPRGTTVSITLPSGHAEPGDAPAVGA